MKVATNKIQLRMKVETQARLGITMGKVVIAAVAVPVVIQETVEAVVPRVQVVATRKVGQCVFCLQS